MTEQTDYSGIGSVIKWSAIGVLVLGTTVTGGYLMFAHIINQNKKDNEFANGTGVSASGKLLSTVGIGKTPSAYATLINAALKATFWGVPDTDEETVYKNLRELKTQYEVALVSKSYEALYKKTLNEGLSDDLDDDEFAIAINIITSKPTGATKK